MTDDFYGFGAWYFIDLKSTTTNSKDFLKYRVTSVV